MADVVFDSSAILALLHREQGADIVEGYVGRAMVSAVNVGELAARLADRGLSDADIRTVVGAIGLEVVPFDEQQAFASADLRAGTRTKGLSLGDRACLALAKTRNLPAFTADRVWIELDLGIDVRLIRGN